MANDFQTWLKAQGYEREYETYGAWFKDNILVSEIELQNKMDQWNMFCNFQIMKLIENNNTECENYFTKISDEDLTWEVKTN